MTTIAAATVLDTLSALGVDVDTSPRRIAEYSYDASNYRLTPLGVCFPRSADEVVRIVRACRETGTPLTTRGGGTSMAGSAIGRGIVIDLSRHLNRVLEIDAESKTARAEAGIVLSRLQARIREASDDTLDFAPDPSSRTRATLGGAIANDACGNRSVRHGRTSDHIESIELVTASGHRITATRHGLEATDPRDGDAAAAAEQLNAQLKELASDNLKEFRLELERIPRQVSGYHLAKLLPENGFDVARSLAGSEGTLAIVVAATVRLVPTLPAALLLTLGYRSVVDAARDVMIIRAYSPTAIEGVDAAIVDTVRRLRGPASVTALPEGEAWLYVELDGDDPELVATRAESLLAELREAGRLVEGRAVPDTTERAALWRVREDGAGLTTRLHTGQESWPGWEDSAVAPENLADYLADFEKLLERFSLDGVMYGHFGAGCMHIRITFDQRTEHGRAVMGDFLKAAAHLVVEHGGSLSGEHGDGRARSELLPIMYSPTMLSAFARFKKSWDPEGLLNPGVLVDPEPMLESLALVGVPDREWRTSFDLTPVTASSEPATESVSVQARPDPFVHALQRCVGVGRCRADAPGFMCPSFRATQDEKDSTRGRARVLQEMVRTAPSVEAGWRSREVRDVLDLCLSCKACSTDCPVGVDMATYKSEFFDHYYEGRLRPASHYSLGWLPRWLKLTRFIAPLVNLALKTPLKHLARLAGLTTKRALPRFTSARALRRQLDATPVPNPDVVLVVDSFTKGFRPEVAGAAQRVLGAAGDALECNTEVCCGLTFISTGQLGAARRTLERAVEILDDGSERPIVVVEPSCAAALNKDLPELVHTDAARRVAGRVRSFAVHVGERVAQGWVPEWPDGAPPREVTVQTHCHEYSVFGAQAQSATLRALGVESVRESSGCCGVAGNFGFEAEHFDVSMKVAELSIAPALEKTAPDTPILADGFSCGMQVVQLQPERRSLHLAQLLDGATTSRTEGADTTTHDKKEGSL